MPNWVFNDLTLSGPKSELDRLKEQVNAPFTVMGRQYSKPVFAFWNIIKPEPTVNYDVDWYGWNATTWGTKWDVAVHDDDKYAETELVEESEDSLYYKFSTAWDTVFPVMYALSEQYPDLTLELAYEEEQGWGGNAVWRGGQIVHQVVWDIPYSHADYVEQGREEACGCSAGPDWAFQDCPIDPNFYEFDTMSGSWVSKPTTV